MAVKAVKVHPAIGVARVGNSPDQYFIGPERPGQRLEPVDGFKDSQLRVKRQAARFRVFAYYDDGQVRELNAANARIKWTVEVANKKASVNSRNSGSPESLSITPGPVTLDAPQQRKLLDGGAITLDGATVAVSLGEVRTDADGHLLFLGGAGRSASPAGRSMTSFYDNPGWFDDVCDGPIRAEVVLDGQTFDADPGWVIVGPPKFAPQLDSIVTLYDTLYDLAVRQGWLTPVEQPSYTQHIQPILQRTRDARWVSNVGTYPHAWPEPVYDAATRQRIYGRLRGSQGAGDGNPNNDTMPALAGGAQLTATQLRWMAAWRDGNFARDWGQQPSDTGTITPAGLDRAALDGCVGAAFFPGIEAGGITQNPILDAATFAGHADPLRVNTAVRGPGDLGAFMALPWQADFNACDDGWWPVPRPNWVKVPSENAYKDWDRDVDSFAQMVDRWHTLGFVVRQGDEYVETERVGAGLNIALITELIDLGPVELGPSGIAGYVVQPVVFEVSAAAEPVTLRVTREPSSPQLSLLSSEVSVGATRGSEVASAKLFVIYQTVHEEVLTDRLVIQQVGAERSWTVQLRAHSTPRTLAATALLIDHASAPKLNPRFVAAALRATSAAITLMHEGDALSITRYAAEVTRIAESTVLDAPSASAGARAALERQLVAAFERGAAPEPPSASNPEPLLDTQRALAISLPGRGRPALVDDLAQQPAELRACAIKLGQPADPSVSALQAATTEHQGYLLAAGLLADPGGTRLTQDTLQAVASLQGAQVALTQSGSMLSGSERRIPFQLSEADLAVEVVLIAPADAQLRFALQTPNGFVIEPAVASARSMQYAAHGGMRFYRFVLPTEIEPARFDQEGTWHALIRYGKLPPSSGPAAGAGPLAQAANPLIGRIRGVSVRSPSGSQPAPFSSPVSFRLLVHTYSRSSLRAHLVQSSDAPGANVELFARLSECEVFELASASVWAEVRGPDGLRFNVELNERTQLGEQRGAFVASRAGVYRIRVRGRAVSRRGHTFQRELTLSAQVWSAGAGTANNAPLV